MARAPAATEIEALPEADRLEGFLHPRDTPRLFGHEEQERELAAAFNGGQMHHAWLITGPGGIGKATLAYRFAAFVLARGDERDMFGGNLDIAADTPTWRQIRAQSHPGLLVIRRPYDQKGKKFRTEITVEEARRLKGFLSMTAEEGGWRAVIVDTADELNANAANALLKSLEEPPARTVFLLLSAQPGALLPTIRSRCRLLALSPLADEPLRKAVQQAVAASAEDLASAAVPEAGEWEELLRLSGGSVRRLLALKASGGLELHRRIVKRLDALPRVDWEDVHKLGDELGSNAAEQRFQLFFELFSGLLARLIRQAASGEGAGPEAALSQRLIPEAKLASWAELWETAGRDKALVEALNLDRKALILETFARLEALARR